MGILYDEVFLKSVKGLPKPAKRKLSTLLIYLQEDPFHPYLHTKRLSGNLYHIFSFRITREWRVLFTFASKDTIHLLDVGHRKDIYR